jgi:cation diffusion facilitator CzcD-associated flavoprotein CzcO
MRAAAPLRAAAARLAPQPACAGMTAAASAPPPPPPRRLSVAVVGAGAAGLAAARELLREGHAVTVFEQGAGVGGQWRFSDNCEADDLLGRAPARRVPGSVYASLRTNLPREVVSSAASRMHHGNQPTNRSPITDHHPK